MIPSNERGELKLSRGGKREEKSAWSLLGGVGYY